MVPQDYQLEIRVAKFGINIADNHLNVNSKFSDSAVHVGLVFRCTQFR
jgi:hypothetical protein